MCGIAGMAGVADEPLLREMLDRVRYRGPNDSGTYTSDGLSAGDRVALGNNRLSIIDLSASGHQPMCNEDRSVWVAYNGEIYNFQELRAELISDGHHFRSHSDTEVLVHLYEKYGKAMVKHLNGMFAFAIWDTKTKTLFIFRDRMGIKPLYYVQRGERLYFGSEIKALLACPEIKPGLDLWSLQQYLTFSYVPSPNTLFEGVSKLPPAHILTWRKGEISLEPYWDLAAGDYYKESESELAERLAEIIGSATKRQLISDVPVGFFLSGGLDSSTLVAAAAQFHGARLRCYSIGFQEQHAQLEQCTEDARYARLVANHFDAEFHELVVQPDVINLLPRVIWHLDDLIADHAAIATYLICREARPDVTVLLSGQGADEIFGGYRVHLGDRLSKWLRLIPAFARRGLRSSLASLGSKKASIPGVQPGFVLAASRYADRLLRTSELQPREQYTALRSYFTEQEMHALVTPELRADSAGLRLGSTFSDYFDAAAGQDFLNQMLYVDAKTFLAEFNLCYSDRLSMACSLEVRVPFLDNEIVDFMGRVPPTMKIKGLTQKHILRKAMKGRLPKAVLRRRKAGFGLPARSWLRNELREMVGDLLSPERVRRRGLFNPAVISNFIEMNNSGKRDYTMQLWALLSLELWQETFVDQTSSKPMESMFV